MRKQSPTPNTAMITPPAAGPIMRAADTTVELIPIARGSDGPCTSSETNAWRVGVSNDRATPRPSARIHTIHNSTTPVSARMPSTRASRPCAAWVPMSSLRLSTASATDPVHAPSTSTGTVCSATVTPSALPLELSVRTSHACATVCSHVPGTEISWPEKYRR